MMVLIKKPKNNRRGQTHNRPRRVITDNSHSSGGGGNRKRRGGRNRRPVRKEVSAGGVVARKDGDSWLVALLKTEHKRGEVWVLPKGHVEPDEGETVSDAAKREVQEEAGVTSLSVKDQLGITRYSFQAEEALVKKTVHYFLMLTEQKRLVPQEEEFLIEAIWLPIDEAINKVEYDTDKRIIGKAREKLTGKPVGGNYGNKRSGRRSGRGGFGGGHGKKPFDKGGKARQIHV